MAKLGEYLVIAGTIGPIVLASAIMISEALNGRTSTRAVRAGVENIAKIETINSDDYAFFKKEVKAIENGMFEEKDIFFSYKIKLFDYLEQLEIKKEYEIAHKKDCSETEMKIQKCEKELKRDFPAASSALDDKIKNGDVEREYKKEFDGRAKAEGIIN